VIARDTLRILNSILHRCADNPRIALFRVNILLPIHSQDLILSHKPPVQTQAKNKWLWDFMPCLQKTQVGSRGINLNRSRVRSLPRIASQRMKLYLGRDHCSQTTWFHGTTNPTGRKKLYAWRRNRPAAEDHRLIKDMLASESSQCWEMRSLTEMIAFHNGEEEECAWTDQTVPLLK
jgi:hypothetical protein